MSQLQKNYPLKSTDKEIKELLSGYSDDIFNSNGDINIILRLSPLIQIGLQELQDRQNKKIIKTSLFISFMSLIISGFTLVFSTFLK